MTDSPSLQTLTRLYGVLPAYEDGQGQRHAAGEDTLKALMVALGAPAPGPQWAARALADRREMLLARGFDTPAVAWEGQQVAFALWLEEETDAQPLRATALLQGGGETPLLLQPVAKEAVAEGLFLFRFTARPGAPLPFGAHRLRVAWPGQSCEAPLLAAPLLCPPLAAPPGKRGRWGLFAPVQSLWRARPPGIASYSELAQVAQGLGELGAGALAVLPLLPTFGDDPSPYQPVSRLFWSDLWVDPAATSEWPHCPAAWEPTMRQEGQVAAAAFLEEPLVDVATQGALRRAALGALANFFFAHGGGEQEDFAAFLREVPQARDYALFRAQTQQQGALWPEWPQALWRGGWPANLAETSAFRYHLYTQFAARRQLAALKETARQSEVLLVLDLPLGAHPGGYDTFAHRGDFAPGVSVGAPPDGFFHEGQNWGFPPLLPDSLMHSGLAHTAACLDHHLQLADVLRLDHVMGLERLYLVPAGQPATRGAYVACPREALTALVCLKAHQHGVAIQGENLGTVSGAMQQALVAHRLHRSFVLPFEQTAPPQNFHPPAPDMVASLNTHDMPPLAGYVAATDVDVLAQAGFLGGALAVAMRRDREGFARALAALPLPMAGEDRTDGAADLLWRGLNFLAASDAALVILMAADLWLETAPLNVPGLSAQAFPSWRRRLPGPVKALLDHPTLALAADLFRRQGR